MSVTGEFRRLVADCIAFLEGSDAAGATQRADALRVAAALAPNDLSEAAARVLVLVEGSGSAAPIEFSTPAERDEFDHLWDHAVAIARVVLGRPEV